MRKRYRMGRRHSRRTFRRYSRVHKRNLRASRGGVRF